LERYEGAGEVKSWNDQWGHWQGLESAVQSARYQAIASIIERSCPQGSLLDVGCGEAVLWDYLPKGITCLGIEPSAAASETAGAKYGRDRIIHSTAEAFRTREQRWDCIVFNEVLYYFANLSLSYAGIQTLSGQEE
jgi:predicted TPR repeat methyltransferase